MTEGTIEILGQKLSYPTTWHGTASVLVVGSAITIITLLLVGWATPEVLRGIKGLNSTSEQQQTINSNFVTELESLSARLLRLESLMSNAQAQTPGGDQQTTNAQSEEQIENVRLDTQLSISKLREQIATQELVRLNEVAPAVSSIPLIDSQVQQVFQQQQQQQQLQKNIQQQQQQQR